MIIIIILTFIEYLPYLKHDNFFFFLAFCTLFNFHKNRRSGSLGTLSKFRWPASDKLKPCLFSLCILWKLLSFPYSSVFFSPLFVQPHTRRELCRLGIVSGEGEWIVLGPALHSLAWDLLLALGCEMG